MPYINIGILAHVDAGKTGLTEYLLYQAGVIRTPGRVDKGTTQTDTLELERQRGITIKSAVASFQYQGTIINLIDTPGHPDFIAEVERALKVLDAAVLVVSAVEGLQSQTRILLAVLDRLHLPTILFLNKIDRVGADPEAALRALREAAGAAVVAEGRAVSVGERTAGVVQRPLSDPGFRDEVLSEAAEEDDELVARYLIQPEAVQAREIQGLVARAVRARRILPAYPGSAMTGAGVEALMAGLASLAVDGGVCGGEALRAEVFKLDRGPGSMRAAYVRMRAGRLQLRDRVVYGRGQTGTVAALEGFVGGPAARTREVTAGQIAKVYGLSGVHVGDVLGDPGARRESPSFPPPMLESAVEPSRPGDRVALYEALTELSEEDPLIGLRRDSERGQVLVSLYGDVQKDVILETLRADYQLEALFSDTRVLHVERPLYSGERVEVMGEPTNPFRATIGLRVDRDEATSGIQYSLEVELGSLPLAFHQAVEDAAVETLRQGLYGWPVTGVRVTMTRSGYDSVASTAGDFRRLAPLVVMSALKEAQTEVLEPYHRFSLDVPEDTAGAVLGLVVRRHGTADTVETAAGRTRLAGLIPVAEIVGLKRELPGKSRGEGVMTTDFDRFQPVRGEPPVRPRTGPDPGNPEAYLMWVRRVGEV
ncbi:MAG: GTP-binding protein [Clostridia bacterium]